MIMKNHKSLSLIRKQDCKDPFNCVSTSPSDEECPQKQPYHQPHPHDAHFTYTSSPEISANPKQKQLKDQPKHSNKHFKLEKLNKRKHTQLRNRNIQKDNKSPGLVEKISSHYASSATQNDHNPTASPRQMRHHS